MSKINAVRLINVNYNNNAIRISDECFHFNGESTLLSLRNGGGKSVLVQMMTAPFVHKRYRDAKDRPFESYFTTGKPSFILVEWALDQGAGYVMTGMMVRRNQSIGEDDADALEMVNFISEYRGPCVQDIHHLPVVEKGKKEMVLKNFSACRQMFEAYKKDRSMQFFHYDMNNPAQSRQYFDKLLEYQVNYKEWETIIKKVNLKESGLSELFADCRDEKGLVEKWFLDAVESKLNKDKNRMKEFQVILEKYVGQYKDNQSKIRRRDTILAFEGEAARIQKRAEDYQEADLKKQSQENKVANFIKSLQTLRDQDDKLYQDILLQVQTLREEIARVEYERLSGEVHKLTDKMNFHTSNRDMIGLEKDGLEREAEQTKHLLHLLACARQQGTVDEERAELEIIRQKLFAVQKRDEELEPERRKLGGRLCFYYEKRLEDNEVRIGQNKEGQVQAGALAGTLQKEAEGLEQAIRQKAAEEGALKSKVQAYDRQEERYNTRYKAGLARNILGEYEPGALEILQKTYGREQEEAVRDRLRKKKLYESGQENVRRLDRTIEDLRQMLLRRKMEKERQEEIRQGYEKELEARRVVLKYLNLEEKQLFDKDGILRASKKMLQEIEGIRRNLEKELDTLEKEHQRLSLGKTLDLPGELEAELSGKGIHLVYGMEWLQKNGHTEDENRGLVRRHPFLPYALILTRADLEKVRRSEGSIYTSFPVPIVVREELIEEKEGIRSGVVSLPGVSFYVLFNENLLNEEKLRLLVLEKERQVRRVEEAAAIRKREYEEYFKRQEVVENQEVTKERYEENGQKLAGLFKDMAELEENLRRQSEAKAKQEEELDTLDAKIREADRRIEFQNRRGEDFGQLCEAYEAYMQDREGLEACRKQMAGLEEQKGLALARLGKTREALRSLEAEQDGLLREKKEFRDHYLVYEKYADAAADVLGTRAKAVIGQEDAAEMEARFAAVTGNMSEEMQDLENREKRAAKRYEDEAEALRHLQDKYGLETGAWKAVRYNRKEESHQEGLLEDCRRKIENKRMQWGNEDKQIAVVSQQINDYIKRIRGECGQERPLPRNEVQNQDFEARKNQLSYQEREAQKEAGKLDKKLQSYDENLTALAEYNEFPLKEEVGWDVDFAEMDSRELRNFKGILIRDYRQIAGGRQAAKEKLVQELNRIVRMEAFQEDYYKKPLESMMDLTDDAAQVIRQLDITLQSYGTQMQKLEVDISLVEKEKARIVELLEEYVKEVHRNLGKIDHNSTITIRERPVKMLKLQLPEWEGQESLYHIRLQDMVDEVTMKGIAIFGKNENAQEYFGTRITTRNLYDTVVGIGNVQVRLYKIEEQREYPITWAEVARNSGGEGFLSAFVILSSLLYYMRRDDSDIFADRNEGKVLVMDNPFAQTNASHLLKPLMDMAKKTNTQLICLTGLGGESIYNRFNNIYVLNLIAASLRSGLQYLKVDHLRGNEPEAVVVSQVEVVEQQELVF